MVFSSQFILATLLPSFTLYIFRSSVRIIVPILLSVFHFISSCLSAIFTYHFGLIPSFVPYLSRSSRLTLDDSIVPPELFIHHVTLVSSLQSTSVHLLVDSVRD
jgi:hypothetical protein